MNKRDIKRGLEFIRMGCSILQNDAKAHNLELFNQSQQRIKARHSAAQSADNTIAATAALNADTSEIKGVNHVE
ncbi:MAG: hypothetical protein U1E99_00720 [Agitococcus sp.]